MLMSYTATQTEKPETFPTETACAESISSEQHIANAQLELRPSNQLFDPPK